MVNVVYRGFQAKVTKDGTTIAKAESATLEISRGSESYHEIGTLNSIEVMVTAETIRGTISKAWIDPYWLAVMKDLSGGDIYFYPLKTDTTCYVIAQGIVVDTFGINVPSDGWIMSDIDYSATNWLYYPTTGSWEA